MDFAVNALFSSSGDLCSGPLPSTSTFDRGRRVLSVLSCLTAGSRPELAQTP